MGNPAEQGLEPIRVGMNFIAKHAPMPGGYYVVYEDGYTSFSPAAIGAAAAPMPAYLPTCFIVGAPSSGFLYRCSAAAASSWDTRPAAATFMARQNWENGSMATSADAGRRDRKSVV